MSYDDRKDELDSITNLGRALEVFSNRRELIRLFVNFLNDEPPPNRILYFHGDGGNGKSLLLKYLERHFLKRFTRNNWTWMAGLEDDNEFFSQVKDAENTMAVPYAGLNFGISTIETDQPKQAFFGLLMLRRELAKYRVKFPIFDFANVWYLHKTEELNGERLKKLLPAEELDLTVEIINGLSQTNWGTMAKPVLNVFAKNVQTNYTLYLQRRGIDRERIAQIERMDVKTELFEHLPQFFAADLIAFMDQPDAPARLVLFFDTHESFWGADKAKSPHAHFGLDEWFRLLLCELESEPRIIRVVGGREHPCREGNQKSWARATRCKIEEHQVEAHLVGHLEPTDADESLSRAGIDDVALRECLIRYAEIAPKEVHPLYLGLCADIVIAAQRRGKQLTAADFQIDPLIEDKERALINRLLLWVDDYTRAAVIALAACRAFNKSLFVELGKSLSYRWENPAFDILKTFSFVWRIERRGEGWYRIHDLLRPLLADYDETETITKAHEFLEQYYRKKYADGDEHAIIEAIYHVNRLDSARGAAEWRDVFDKELWASHYQICRSLREVKQEIIVEDNYLRGRIALIDGDFDNFLSYYKEAERRYADAVAAFDNALDEQANNTAAIYIDKGFALIRQGQIQHTLSNYKDALQKYELGGLEFDKALRLNANDAGALARKAFMLGNIASLREPLKTVEEKVELYRQAVELYEQSLRINANSVSANNNLGCLLNDFGWLQITREQPDLDEAVELFNQSIASYDKALELEPASVIMKVSRIIVFNGLTRVYENMGEDEQARATYQQAINDYDEVLQNNPVSVDALSGKAKILHRFSGFQLYRGLTEEAKEICRKAIANFKEVVRYAPNSISDYENMGYAFSTLGWLYQMLDHYEDAATCFQNSFDSHQKILAITSRSASTLNSMALALSWLAKTQELLKDYSAATDTYIRSLEFSNQALAIDANFAEAVTAKENILRRLGEVKYKLERADKLRQD